MAHLLTGLRTGWSAWCRLAWIGLVSVALASSFVPRVFAQPADGPEIETTDDEEDEELDDEEPSDPEVETVDDLRVDDDPPAAVPGDRDDLAPIPGAVPALEPLDATPPIPGAGPPPNGRPDAGSAPSAFGALPPPEPPPPPQQWLPAIPNAPAARLDRALVTEDALRAALEARAAALRAGDFARAKDQLGLLEELRAELGVQNVVVASAALIHEAVQASDAGRHERAITLADAAARLSPDLPAAHWARARLLASADWTQLGAIAGAITDGVVAQVTHFRNLIVLLSNLVAVGLLALLLTALGFAAIQLFKYVRYPAHDLAGLFPKFIGGGEVTIAFLIIIAAPLAFGFGIMPSIALSLALLLPYQARAERGVGIGMLVVLAAFPTLLRVSAPLITFHGSITDAMAVAMSEAFAGDAEARLEAYAKDHRQDLASALILGHRRRQRGDLEGAELNYGRALAADSRNVVAQNNLGVVNYLLGREEAAESMFRMASMQTARAEPLINLSAVVVDASKFEEGNSLLGRARGIDAELVRSYERLDAGLPTRRKLLECRLDQEILWGHLLEDEGQAAAVAQQLWQPIGGNTPPLAMPVIAAVLAALGLWIARREEVLSKPCSKCGIPARRHAVASLCEQCRSVFLKAVVVEASTRAKKEAAVRRYQRRRRFLERALSVFAGLGHQLGDRPLQGTFYFFVFAAMLVIIFPGGVAADPWAILIDDRGVRLVAVLAGSFAGIATLLSLKGAFAGR